MIIERSANTPAQSTSTIRLPPGPSDLAKDEWKIGTRQGNRMTQSLARNSAHADAGDAIAPGQQKPRAWRGVIGVRLFCREIDSDYSTPPAFLIVLCMPMTITLKTQGLALSCIISEALIEYT